MTQHLSYKGLDIAIEFADDDHATVTIGDRSFDMTRHEGALRMWACDAAYFMSDDLVGLARHLVDYWYIISSADTAPFEGPHHADLLVPPGGVVSAYPTAPRHDHGEPGHHHDDEGDAPKKRGGGRSRRR
jgi:hypothetical protein